jgi:hypothetical protein
MPYDEYQPPRVHQTRDVDLSGLGPDAGDEYTGDSMEDFYDYLLTPRNQRQRSQHGAMTHYGPSRFASVNPEDAAMAQMVMQLMEGEDVREFNQTTRESDMARRAAADEMMMPQGRGGGQMTFTGGAGEGSQEPTRFGAPAAGGPGWAQGAANPQGIQIGGGPPPPQGPVSDRDRMLAAAGGVGGVEESRVAAAEAQGTNYPGHGPQQMSRVDRQSEAKLKGNKDEAEYHLRFMLRNEPEMAGIGLDKLLEQYVTNPESIPAHLEDKIFQYGRAKMEYDKVWGGGQGGGAPAYEFD